MATFGMHGDEDVTGIRMAALDSIRVLRVLKFQYRWTGSLTFHCASARKGSDDSRDVVA